MKPLNSSEINKAFAFFALHFTLLLAFCLLCVYTYFSTAESEGAILVKQINKYDQILAQHQQLADQTSEIYNNMRLLNSDRVSNSLELQRLISNEKEKLNKIMFSAEKDKRDNFIVYDNLSKKLNTLLSLKDSIRLVSIDEDLLRSDLMTCINDNQQFKKKLKEKSELDEAQPK